MTSTCATPVSGRRPPSAGLVEARLQRHWRLTLIGFLAFAAVIVAVAELIPGFLRPRPWVHVVVVVVVAGCAAGAVALTRVHLVSSQFLPIALALDAAAAVGTTMTASRIGAPFCLAALAAITVLAAYRNDRRTLAVQMTVANVILVSRAIASFDRPAEVVIYVLWSEFGLIAPGFAVHLLTRELVDSLQTSHWFASHDVLTGLLNRHGLTEAAPDLVTRAIEAQLPLGAVMCDLDRFKQLNDTHGHAAGDAALQRFADVLEEAADGDPVVRLGGEEFALLRPATADTLAAVGERVCDEVRSRCAEWDLTVSVGVAVHPLAAAPATDPESAVWAVLADADESVYAAKSAGRDQVCVRRGRRATTTAVRRRGARVTRTPTAG